MTRILVLLVLVTAILPAGNSGRSRSKKQWVASWLAVAAANVLDVHSSQGRREANPLLRDSSGRFSVGKASLIKAAVTGGFFAVQWGVVRSRPESGVVRGFTIANTVAAGGLGAVAVRNYALGPPGPRPVPAHLRSTP